MQYNWPGHHTPVYCERAQSNLATWPQGAPARRQVGRSRQSAACGRRCAALPLTWWPSCVTRSSRVPLLALHSTQVLSPQFIHEPEVFGSPSMPVCFMQCHAVQAAVPHWCDHACKGDPLVLKLFSDTEHIRHV